MTEQTDDNDWNEDTGTPYFKPFESGQKLTGVPVEESESQQYGTPQFELELTEAQEVPVGENEVIQMEEGDKVMVSYTATHDFLREHRGDIVRLEYEGEATGESGMPYKTFDRKWKAQE